MKSCKLQNDLMRRATGASLFMGCYLDILRIIKMWRDPKISPSLRELSNLLITI